MQNSDPATPLEISMGTSLDMRDICVVSVLRVALSGLCAVADQSKLSQGGCVAKGKAMAAVKSGPAE